MTSKALRSQRMPFLLAAALLSCVAALAYFALEPWRPGVGISLYFGIAAAALLVVCALLGLRKRMLHLRVGGVHAWTAAHNSLGLLAFVCALLHSRGEFGGPLTTCLLGTLGFVVLSGLVGLLLQITVPKLMTAQLAQELPLSDLERELLERWRAVHRELIGAWGPQPVAAEKLARFETQLGVEQSHASSARPSQRSAGPGSGPRERAGSHDANASREREEESAAQLEALSTFYGEQVASFVMAPKVGHALGTESEAQLVFAALEANTQRSLRPLLPQLESLCARARELAEQRRLLRWLHSWQLAHIPASMLVLLLVALHAAAILYY